MECKRGKRRKLNLLEDYGGKFGYRIIGVDIGNQKDKTIILYEDGTYRILEGGEFL